MNMYCQKCRTPLKADKSLENLNPAALDLLVGASNKTQHKHDPTGHSYPQERKTLYDRIADQSQSPLYKRNIPAPKREDGAARRLDVLPYMAQSQPSNPGMSFIEITESQIVSPDKARGANPSSQSGKLMAKPVVNEKESMSSLMQKHEKLFSILSSHSDIDHPVCTECSALLVSQLNARLMSSSRERDAYASFLKQLQQSSNQSGIASDKELAELTEEEEKTFQELLDVEKEKKQLETELAELEEESRQLDERERRFWESRNEFDEKLHEVQIELISLQEKYANDQKQLERLQRTNVFNDTFCIGHDGYFGTINGLRLGRLPSQNVEWAEINAAWGQTLLLLATVSERLGFQFRNYRLRPLGSTSRIEKLEWPQQQPDTTGHRPQHSAMPQPKVTQLDLFSSGDMALGRVFNHRRFDAGMVAFLDCLSQIGRHVENASKPTTQSSPRSPRQNVLVLPYKIQNDKIDDVSIRLGVGFSQDENFTKACKYTLTCCKFLLAHVSNLESSRS